MKETQVRKEGLLMLVLFTALFLLSVYVPAGAVVGAFFLLLPFLVYSAKHPAGPALLLFGAALAVSLFIGGAAGLLVALMYGTTGAAMGMLIRKKSEPWMVYVGGSLVFLLNIVIQYAGAALLLDVSFFDGFVQTFQQSMQETSAMLGQEVPYSEEEINELVRYISALLPALFTLTAFTAILLISAVTYPLAKKLGVPLKPLQPFQHVRLPKAILWYYLIFMVGALLVKPESGTTWYDMYINVMFILQTCLYVHGLSFVFFWAHHKKWPKAVPVVIAVFSLPLFPLLYLIRLLGILDLGFDLRQRAQRKP